MANKNRNRGSYASNENWENPGYNRERDYSQGGYGQDYGDLDYGREDYNRNYGYGRMDRNVNYQRDFDDYGSSRDRRFQRGFGNTESGNLGQQGYGNYGSYQGSQYSGDFDRKRRMDLSEDNENYGSSFNASGDPYYGRNRYWRDDEVSYGKNDRQRKKYRDENIYGGDTRNYGNASQGGYDRGWWDRTRDEVSSWFGDEDAERRRRLDKGEFKGVGPKGYKRSDERIREDVSDRLSDDDMLNASNIEIVVNNCDVTLTGTVDSRWAKRRAEDLAERISGVDNVSNQLRVENTGFERGVDLSGTERRRNKTD